MASLLRQPLKVSLGLWGIGLLLLGSGSFSQPPLAASPREDAVATDYRTTIQPLVKKYCLGCHSTKLQKGSLDLERFATVADLRHDLKPWQGMIEQLEAGEMPPKQKPQPTKEEKQKLLTWVRAFLDREARARVGDPGYVPLRRLSNAEYNNTVRDLTGVDLQPAREFPADGAAGEGFTNAAEALSDISPALFTKYLGAAKEIAEHAVFLPDGIRFSPGKTRRDWTDEGTAWLQRFYTEVAPPDGRLHLQPYLLATVRHREALRKGTLTLVQVASREKLNAKYLGILWQTLEQGPSSMPLDSIRAQWRKATPSEVPALTVEIAAWQMALWETARVGSYVRTVGKDWVANQSRQVPHDPAAVEMLPLRLAIKPVPGQNDVILHLAAHDLLPTSPGAKVIWQRLRLEGAGMPTLLLQDYAQYGPALEVDYATVFANTAQYLAAVAEAAREGRTTVAALAQKYQLDPAFLQRWIDVLALEPRAAQAAQEKPGRVVPLTKLELLDEKMARVANKPWLNGWRKKGLELPQLIANAADTVEYIPGKAGPHSVTVHPTPTQFVGVVWKSPLTGKVRVAASIASVHPACGNGVAWWLEHRHGPQARIFAEGTVELGGAEKSPQRIVSVTQGDQLLLAVDARDGNHVCDLTDITLTITEIEKPARTWNLTGDVTGSIHEGNPHADRQGQQGTWSFVLGPTRAVTPSAQALIPPGSLLGQWREIAADPSRQTDAVKLAAQVQALFTGRRPTQKDPNRQLYDRFVTVEGILFRDVELSHLGKSAATTRKYSLPRERFTPEGNLLAASNGSIEIRLPAALLMGREFVVEGKLDQPDPRRAVQFQVVAAATAPRPIWDGKSALVAVPMGEGHRQLQQGFAAFREVFPLFLCFPQVIPNDEPVSLKMFHREDEPLLRLFLNAEQTQRLERLWTEHECVSQQMAAENAYLPQFIEYVTQDQPPEALAYFKSLRQPFQRRAETFARQQVAAQPRHLDALLAFAAKAYRRPLTAKEKTELLTLYQAIRHKGASHEEACRGVLTRIFVAPAFLFRIEKTVAGKEPTPVEDWELATRLSYFLWASLPDEELRQVAASGRLRDPEVLLAQMRRMLKDNRLRALAIEFGTQWLHIRGFDQFNEKNEKLFPAFDAELRQAMYEEAILFFQDLFQQDQSVTDLLDADATYLNERLAHHYGIPGVTGPHWRRVTGVKKFGRGGILGLASIQTKQAGASRTSPILRGNWVVETSPFNMSLLPRTP
jgi:hypothetical protein